MLSRPLDNSSENVLSIWEIRPSPEYSLHARLYLRAKYIISTRFGEILRLHARSRRIVVRSVTAGGGDAHHFQIGFSRLESCATISPVQHICDTDYRPTR